MSSSLYEKIFYVDVHMEMTPPTPCGRHKWIAPSLADPELQKRGGKILAEIFLRLFLGVPEKISAFLQKISSISLMTFF